MKGLPRTPTGQRCRRAGAIPSPAYLHAGGTANLVIYNKPTTNPSDDLAAPGTDRDTTTTTTSVPPPRHPLMPETLGHIWMDMGRTVVPGTKVQPHQPDSNANAIQPLSPPANGNGNGDGDVLNPAFAVNIRLPGCLIALLACLFVCLLMLFM